MANLHNSAYCIIGGGNQMKIALEGIVGTEMRQGNETPKPTHTNATARAKRRHGGREENRSFARRGGDRNPVTTLRKNGRPDHVEWLGQDHQIYRSKDIKGVSTRQYLKLLPLAPPKLEEDPFPQLVLSLSQHQLFAYYPDGKQYFTAHFQRTATKGLELRSFKLHGNGDIVKSHKDPEKKDPVRDEVVNRHETTPNLGWMGGSKNGSRKGELIKFLLENLNRAQPGFISTPLTYLVFRDGEQAALQGFLRNHLVFIASFNGVDNKGGAELIELLAPPQSLKLKRQDRRKGGHHRTVDGAQATSEAWADVNACEFLTREAEESYGIDNVGVWLDQLDLGAEMAAAIERELKIRAWDDEIRFARFTRSDQEYLGWYLCPDEPEHQEVLVNPDPEEVASLIDHLEHQLSDGKRALACQGGYMVGR